MSLLAYRGLFWEHYVPAFGGLFDSAAGQDADKLQQSFSVQLVYFLWGISCVDAMLFYLIVALMFNKLWVVIKFYASIGMCAQR